MVALAAVFVFLAVRGQSGLRAEPGLYAPYASFWPYAAAGVRHAALASVIALLIAIPFAIGVALFISHYAPARCRRRRLRDRPARRGAAVVYGLWGLDYPRPASSSRSTRWLTSNLGWIPMFSADRGLYGRPHASSPRIVLAIMVLPIITAISREIFLQTPATHEEAALALGATRWEMIRTAVLPVRPLRDRLGHHARPRPRARRDDGRRDGALRDAWSRSTCILEHQPGARSPPTSPRTSPSSTGIAGASDRLRAGAVRDHLRGQLRRPLRSSRRRSLRAHRMSVAHRRHRPSTPTRPVRVPACGTPRCVLPSLVAAAALAAAPRCSLPRAGVGGRDRARRPAALPRWRCRPGLRARRGRRARPWTGCVDRAGLPALRAGARPAGRRALRLVVQRGPAARRGRSFTHSLRTISRQRRRRRRLPRDRRHPEQVGWSPR